MLLVFLCPVVKFATKAITISKDISVSLNKPEKPLMLKVGYTPAISACSYLTVL